MKNIKTIIFPASRSINSQEIEEITLKIRGFLTTWEAHGIPLESKIRIEYQQFIIISIDENIEPASGCSLDFLNGFMKEIDRVYQLELFDRMKACYLENSWVKTMKLHDFRLALKNKTIPTDIQIFDFSKSNEQELKEGFLLPLKESWAKELIK